MNIYNDETLDDLQNGYFIIQKKDGFKFGVDAVLLADFAKDAPSKMTLDLCTGTGIVPILLAPKTNTPVIHGLEIQSDIADMAVRSLEYNKIADRVFIAQGDLKNAAQIYGKNIFDKVTCNPPYMKGGAGIINDADTKTISRHEVMCTLDDVIKSVSELLVPKGRFFMVHRPTRIADIMCSMRKYKIEPKKLRFVHPAPSKAPNMVLVEGMYQGGEDMKILPPLYVYNENGNYSEEIDKIYGRQKL